MKILITGTNGAIGKEIAQRLKKNKKNKLILFGRKRDLTKPRPIPLPKDGLIVPLVISPIKSSPTYIL